MANVYTKEHNAQMRIKDSPYAGAARVLGYDDKQRGWIDDIRDARKAEEKQQKRKDILGFLLMCLGYLGVFLLIAGLFAGGFHVLSQAHNGGATTKPAVTSSVLQILQPLPLLVPPPRQVSVLLLLGLTVLLRASARKTHLGLK